MCMHLHVFVQYPCTNICIYDVFVIVCVTPLGVQEPITSYYPLWALAHEVFVLLQIRPT